ncbi:MAG TPA: response regulator [Rhodopila sp.]|nr:response regulator [Rhodopila sp.]
MNTTETVIIADRDPLISNALRVEFSHRDFLVLLASSAGEAEDYARQTTACLIVLDIVRPLLPGYDACARIRRRDGYQQCPIILTASGVSDAMRAAAEHAGASGVLAKNYSFSDLTNAVLPHVPADHPISRKLAMAPGVAAPAQQAWSSTPSLSWRYGKESRLSHNGRLMSVVRGNGVRMPLVKGG